MRVLAREFLRVRRAIRSGTIEIARDRDRRYRNYRPPGEHGQSDAMMTAVREPQSNPPTIAFSIPSFVCPLVRVTMVLAILGIDATRGVRRDSRTNSTGLAAEDHHDIEVFSPNQIGYGTQYHLRLIAGLRLG
jgi:hypothetical protein